MKVMESQIRMKWTTNLVDSIEKVSFLCREKLIWISSSIIYVDKLQINKTPKYESKYKELNRE